MRPFHITATGDVGPAQGLEVGGVVLSAGSANATLTLKEGGSSGTTILVLTALANSSATLGIPPMNTAGQLHATLSGSGASACVIGSR